MKKFLILKPKTNFIIFLGMLFLYSCSQEKKVQETQAIEIPNFSNVSLQDVFSEEDNVVENESVVMDSIEKYYQNTWEMLELSGGFLVAKGDRILYEKYAGFANVDKQNPINSKTSLHLASVGKSLTAMVILKLAEAGMLDLHQKINTILPKFPYPDIEVVHLLNHRSGIPKYEHFLDELEQEKHKDYYTNSDLLGIIIKYQPQLEKPVNSGFMYCNTNYAILALVIEKICQQRYPEAMKKILFDPLEMGDTFVFQEKNLATASQSFFYKDWKLYPLDKLDLIYGDKNIYSTPQDLFKFSKALYAKNFLRKDLMEKIFTPYSNEKKGINNYGLGFRMKIFDENRKLTYHNGWWHGSNTAFIHLIDSKVTIIALGNRYSKKIYESMRLTALFEDFPFSKEETKAWNNKKSNEIIVNDAFTE